MKNGSGFIAALDQSGGSTPKALSLYGIDSGMYGSEAEMFELMHEMRVRIVSSPSFSEEKIIAAILFVKTMDSQIHGKPAPAYLWEDKGVMPFLKVDDGLMGEDGGVQLMRPIPDLDGLLARAVENGICGTKMRSVINSPFRNGIQAIVDQQFELAERILAFGLIPIVEPEVSIGSPEKRDCENILKSEILRRLDGMVNERGIVLKLTLPSVPNEYRDLIMHDRVLRVSALSGGYSSSEACSYLEANNGMIASFSRALTEGLKKNFSEEEFERVLSSSINKIYRASCT
ncbi:MAG: fructose bisphosphate aldolase [Albidovulum sp.]|nr:fructose bisphosphate aldolase [Albidovulum sp.]